ncbi:hypothetical protein HW555_013684 [Spodoptera exigua]|uniref:DDE Tnp4 domain-containing protein n=1 Tax=Spodoptera exigua TaxID=7107 RepID=A0A835KXX1_SPOEX|nr:hypothetical protein HW555_013684 [Spodoptera exigua]
MLKAKRRDNVEKRRQAHVIRNMDLLTTDTEFIKVFRLTEELIKQLEEDISPFLAKTKRQGFKMPGTIGCVDGTLVSMVRPKQHEERYYCRKGYRARNAVITPVSLLDHIHMMVPCSNPGPKSKEEYYNNLHAAARNTAERTIGILKGRFRCLLVHRVLNYDPEMVGKIIKTCCVLHNICNQARDPSVELPTHLQRQEASVIRLLQQGSQNYIWIVDVFFWTMSIWSSSGVAAGSNSSLPVTASSSEDEDEDVAPPVPKPSGSTGRRNHPNSDELRLEKIPRRRWRGRGERVKRVITDPADRWGKRDQCVQFAEEKGLIPKLKLCSYHRSAMTVTKESGQITDYWRAYLSLPQHGHILKRVNSRVNHSDPTNIYLVLKKVGIFLLILHNVTFMRSQKIIRKIRSPAGRGSVDYSNRLGGTLTRMG